MTEARVLPTLPDFRDFLLGSPLYAAYARPSVDVLRTIFFEGKSKFDGHCPRCGRETTYTANGPMMNWGADSPPIYPPGVSISCARVASHYVTFWMRVDRDSIQKVGQYPSLADIANDQTKSYRSVLSADDGAEFHRAVGLAAHGVGIAAFVYLRRIFERLILARFEEFKELEGWSDGNFSVKMSEKIALLKDHLPPFLVENQKIYGILSLGVHELSEEDCLGFFEVLKASIVMILEEDKIKKAELARREELKRAIQQFSSAKPAAAK